MSKTQFNSPLAEILDNYANRCKAQYAEETFIKYRHILHHFDTYLDDTGYSYGELTAEVLSGWIGSLSGLSPNTILIYEAVISGFLAFAHAFGIASHMPPAVKASHEYQPAIFLREEIEALCRIADSIRFHGNPSLRWIEAEMPMIIRMLFGCGLRLGETVALQMKNIDLSNALLTMRHTKKDKERLVPMSESLNHMLQRYCMALGVIGIPNAYIFPADSFENHLTNMHVYHRFCRILKEAGYEAVRERKNKRTRCIHCIRHSYVVYAIKHLRDQGIRIDDTFPYLSVYLGHSTLYETQKYMKFSSELFPEETSYFDDHAAEVYNCRIFHLDDEEWQ